MSIKPENNYRELNEWLEEKGFKVHNMQRDFMDAILLAKLLKQIFPKYVDLHNYPPCNKFELKLVNWQTLNSKVLSKLKLAQSPNVLERLAKGSKDDLEFLLYKIMKLELSNKKIPPTSEEEQEKIWQANEEILMVNINKNIGDAIIKVPQKMILYSLYENVLNELALKENALQIANAKITHLKKMLELKSQRIEELICRTHKIGDVADGGGVRRN